MLLDEQQKQLDMVGKYFPKFTGSGVVTVDPEGNMIPVSWGESIRKLDELDAWERRLQQREKQVRVREVLLPGTREPGTPES